MNLRTVAKIVYIWLIPACLVIYTFVILKYGYWKDYFNQMDMMLKETWRIIDEKLKEDNL
jgi:hypothetical protein